MVITRFKKRRVKYGDIGGHTLLHVASQQYLLQLLAPNTKASQNSTDEGRIRSLLFSFNCFLFIAAMDTIPAAATAAILAACSTRNVITWERKTVVFAVTFRLIVPDFDESLFPDKPHLVDNESS
mmetsp:Transcript_17039/g.20507  ORF Transcript_17039/g.20507 Transcript_17039/m.20507 type:complete len:125 (+) Transcript_17039:251-625(+)